MKKIKAAHKQLVRGFTIIELMIAMTILSFIALAVYQNTTQSFIIRDNVERDGDFYNAVRIALDVMGRDITHIYSPQAASLPGNIGKAKAPNPQNPGQNFQGKPGSDFWGETINEYGVRPSRLVGEGEKISFITNSHMRMYRDSNESEFAKIRYALGEEKLAQPGQTGKVLVKYEDSNAFEENDNNSQTAIRYPILSGVKSLKFRFLDGEKDQFDNRWDTTGMNHKGKFPAVIEVTLEIFVPATQSTMTVVQLYRPELPL